MEREFDLARAVGGAAWERTTPTGSAVTKAEIASLYNVVAEAYGNVGPPFLQIAGERLVEAAAIRAGERVLDVATGRGAALFPAAEAVGPTGTRRR